MHHKGRKTIDESKNVLQNTKVKTGGSFRVGDTNIYININHVFISISLIIGFLFFFSLSQFRMKHNVTLESPVSENTQSNNPKTVKNRLIDSIEYIKELDTNVRPVNKSISKQAVIEPLKLSTINIVISGLPKELISIAEEVYRQQLEDKGLLPTGNSSLLSDADLTSNISLTKDTISLGGKAFKIKFYLSSSLYIQRQKKLVDTHSISSDYYFLKNLDSDLKIAFDQWLNKIDLISEIIPEKN